MVEHIKGFGGLDRMTPVRKTRGDKDLSTVKPREHFLHFSSRLRGVGVVEDQEPAGMLVELAEQGGQRAGGLQSAARFARRWAGDRALMKSSAV